MNVLVTAYERKMAGRDKDARRAAHKGAKTRVYKPIRNVPTRDRWDG